MEKTEAISMFVVLVSGVLMMFGAIAFSNYQALKEMCKLEGKDLNEAKVFKFKTNCSGTIIEGNDYDIIRECVSHDKWGDCNEKKFIICKKLYPYTCSKGLSQWTLTYLILIKYSQN